MTVTLVTLILELNDIENVQTKILMNQMHHSYDFFHKESTHAAPEQFKSAMCLSNLFFIRPLYSVLLGRPKDL